jgi:hypothetical protein
MEVSRSHFAFFELRASVRVYDGRLRTNNETEVICTVSVFVQSASKDASYPLNERGTHPRIRLDALDLKNIRKNEILGIQQNARLGNTALRRVADV